MTDCITELVTETVVNKLVTETVVTKLVSGGVQGVPGAAGPAGADGASSVTLIAGETLSALRVVYGDEDDKVRYADKDDLDKVKNIIGVTTQAAAEDDDITVKTLGTIEDVSWNWNLSSDKSLFLDSNGQIIQGPPTGDYIVRIGFAITETSIFVRIGEIISNP